MMLKRLLELHADLVAVFDKIRFLKQKQLSLKENQWKLAEKLVPFLEGLAASTEILCQGQCSNIYSYYPLAFKVIDITKIQAEDNGTLAEFKN